MSEEVTETDVYVLHRRQCDTCGYEHLSGAMFDEDMTMYCKGCSKKFKANVKFVAPGKTWWED